MENRESYHLAQGATRRRGRCDLLAIGVGGSLAWVGADDSGMLLQAPTTIPAPLRRAWD
jgi:hypothetical protein